MVKFQGKSWNLYITRNMSHFHNVLDRWGSISTSHKYGLIERINVAICKDGVASFLFEEQENSLQYTKKLIEICSSRRKLKIMERAFYKFGKNLLKAGEEFEKNISLKIFEKYVLAYKDLAAGLGVTAMLGQKMTPRLKKILIKKLPSYSNEKIEKLIAEITYPSKFTPSTLFEIDLLSLGAELQKKKLVVGDIKKDKNLYKKFLKCFKKYFVIPVNFNEEPWSETEILKQLGDLMKGDCQKERDDILANQKEKIKTRDMALSGLSKEIEQVAISLQVGTYLNEYRKFIFCRASLSYRPFFQKISKLYGLSDWRDLYKLSHEEIISLYFKKNKKILDLLKQREWVGVINGKNLNHRIMSAEEMSPFLADLQKKEDIGENDEKNKKEIKGMIANPGIVKGIVKIIFEKADFSKFKDGDIIVASMTSVDFLPIMKRASAFITNEGGILCHASIVSRELNKPCIINTKIATKVLKDGDLVEVDADNGIVKILKQ